MAAVALCTAVPELAHASVQALGVPRHAVTGSSGRIGTAPRPPSTARRIGPVRGSRAVALDVVLAPRHARSLAALVQAVSDPSSPEYRRYLSRGEFARRFGATSSAIAALEGALRHEGLRPTGVSGDRLAVHVEATARTVERAFATPLTSYGLPGGRRGWIEGRAPRVPRLGSARVQAVLGLDTLDVTTPADLTLPRQAGAKDTGSPVGPSSPVGLPGPAGPVPTAACAAQARSAGYTADQIASAYGYDSLYAAGDFGAGSTVGLIEFSPISASDLATYAGCYSIASPSISVVDVDGGPSSASPGNEVEAELDVEDVLGLAPAAHIVLYEGSDSGGGVSGTAAYDAYATAIDQDAVRVISTSWGGCEASVGAGAADAESVLFAQAAIQGQTVVAAAGDEGSEDCYGTLVGAPGQALAVDDPASQPYVTAVGGTTLSLGATDPETVWDTTLHGGTPGAGGGGVSRLWALPSYQATAPAALGVGGSLADCPADVVVEDPPVAGGAVPGGRCREVPDVSANAGAPYAMYCTVDEPNQCSYGGWTGLGGTSAAAPTWAALFELADASPACTAAGPIGFANPALYAAAASSYATTFTDISTGSNDLTGGHPGDYRAGRGFDLASGLGTPIAGDGSGGGLVAALCSTSTRHAAGGNLPQPVVAGVQPRAIRARPGVHVVITGSNFTGASAVHFGARPAESYEITSRTSIVAVAPTGAGRVHVTVTTRAGTSRHEPADVFDYLVPPRVQRLAPSTGPSRGGTVVLVGRYLAGASRVLFGDRPAVSFTVRSPSRIVAVSPAGTGTVVVTVRTRGGTSAPLASDRYHYVGSP